MEEKENINEIMKEELETAEVVAQEAAAETEAEVEVEVEAETEAEVVTEIETEAETEVPEEEKVTVLKGSRGPRPRGERGEGRKRRIETVEPEQSEWKEQVVQIRRVTKVVKGGKKLSFRAIVIVGNKNGQVGMGVAKAAEVIIAIQKAVADARKNLVSVPIYRTTIPHIATATSGAGSVILRPASQGTGVIAGGAVRAVLELAGIENILAKSLGSKSPLNAASATLNALKSLRTFNDVARARGITVKKMLSAK